MMAGTGKIALCRRLLSAGLAPLAMIPVTAAMAQEVQGQPAASTETWAVHGQATAVAQGTPGFHSPYEGPASFQPHQLRENVDATLFLGVRPWAGAELWVNPEIDQGHGLSDTLGVAGFPNAEAFKVGHSNPHFRLQRLFLRQTIGLGGENQVVAGEENRLAGIQSADRLVLTLGKLSVADVFDTNAYAHDPRRDFLNLALVDTGSYDYASDAWGYSYGVVAEWFRGNWTWRAGLFSLSKTPGGEQLESSLGQYQIDGEVEHRHTIGGRPGAIRLTGFRSRGRFARYNEAVALAHSTGQPADAALVRRPMTRVGFSLNAEQEVSDALSLFLRSGMANGAVEAYDFSDIDRTVAVGGVLSGKSWGRQADKVGLALAVNGISRAHKQYLDAGGVGLLVGDGQLPRPGAEVSLEGYYAWQPVTAITLTIDYQFIANPAFNRDRGPIQVLGLRAHGEF